MKKRETSVKKNSEWNQLLHNGQYLMLYNKETWLWHSPPVLHNLDLSNHWYIKSTGWQGILNILVYKLCENVYFMSIQQSRLSFVIPSSVQINKFHEVYQTQLYLNSKWRPRFDLTSAINIRLPITISQY